jgi:hypothetical protein
VNVDERENLAEHNIAARVFALNNLRELAPARRLARDFLRTGDPSRVLSNKPK